MSGLLKGLAGLVLGLVMLVAGLPAAAQSLGLPAAAPEEAAPRPEITPEQAQALIATLQDPARREELVQQLEALLAVTEPATPEAEAGDAVGWLLEEVDDRTDVVRQVVGTVIQSFDEVPLLLDWLEDQLLDPATREIWLWVGFRVLLVLGIGLLALVVMGLALRRLRHNLTQPPAEGVTDRLARTFLWLIVELMPVAAFTMGAYGTLSLLEMHNMSRMVVLPLVNAVIVVRTGVALFRIVFAPKAPALRLFPMTDGTAAYINRWLRRFAATSVYGYSALAAARQLGLPWTLHGLLLHLLFFSVAIMAIVVILQSRERVASWIAQFGSEDRSPAMRRLPWGTLASLWHILALLYVISIYLVWALKIPGGFAALTEATIGSVVIVIGGWLVWRLVNQAFAGRLTAPEEGRSQSLLQRRVGRYLPIAAAVTRTALIVLIVFGLLEVWGFGTLTWLFSEAGNTMLGRVITVAVIVLITLGVWEIASYLIERSITDEDEEGNLRLSNRTRTLLNIIRNVLLVLLSLIGLFLILSELGLDVAPLLAGAGVIGLAIGFGSQKLVQDIITGMFMLLGDTIRVGDVVTLGGQSGVVEEVSMRTVQLRDYGGNVHTIPYSAIDIVTNMTKEYSYALFDIGVAYRENVDEVMETLRTLGAEMSRDAYFRRLILEPLEIAGVDQFAASQVTIRLRFKTRPLRQWEVRREFLRRVKNRFDELGIEIPFPHQTVYFGADKSGRAQPAVVAMAPDPAPLGLTESKQREEPPAEAVETPTFRAQSRG